MKIEQNPITPQQVFSLIGKEDGVFLDIGANNGATTRNMHRAMKNMTIHAFEVDPRAIEKFRRNINSPNVHLHEIAIGDTDGELDFYVSSGSPPSAEWWKDEERQGWDLSGSLKKPTGHLESHPWCKFEEKISVPVVTLDTWYNRSNYKTLDFIWADVQGAEGELIRGGSSALNNTRYFYTEYSNRELYEGQLKLDEIVALLPNYEVLKVYPHDVLLRNTAF